MNKGTKENKVIERVMMACVTKEVTMIVQPAKYYNIDKIHLINYVKKSDNDYVKINRSKIYEEIYAQVHNELTELGIKIEKHEESETYIFNKMMQETYKILFEETQKDSIIYVNISGGTNEYAAAAAISSMMFREIKLFNVGSRPDKKTIEDYDERIKALKDKDGKLVGTTMEIYDPFRIDTFPMNPPDDMLLKSLKIFSMIPPKMRSKTHVIRNLILQGLWVTCVDCLDYDSLVEGTSVKFEKKDSIWLERSYNAEYHKLQNKEGVQYHKRYVEKWLKNGWIRNNQSHNKKYILTDAGKTYLDIFCSDDIFFINEENIVIKKKYNET